MAFKQCYPDRTAEEVAGVPYKGIEGLRPETIELVDRYLFAKELAETK